MQVKDTPISDIKIGKRRREDYGDLQGLADSISKYGLLHPITLDDKNNLIAGERRLRACKSLAWSEISARLYRDLTEDERREIELEENIRRKDLTAHERSRNLIALVETAADVLASDSLPNIGNESTRKRGGQPKPDSESKIAERIGVPQQTINDAKKHVAAINKYPELEAIIPTQKDTITVAKNLDKLSEPERRVKLEALTNHDQDVLGELAEKPPVPPRTKKSPGEKWTEVVYELRKMFASIHSLGGIDELTQSWSEREKETYRAYVREMIDELKQIDKSLSRRQAA